MSLFALALVLAAALLHALWNVAAKKAGGDHHFVFMGAVMIVVIWAPVGVVAGVPALPLWGALEWGLVLASGLAHLAYFNVLLKGYRVSDLTVVYPVARGTGPLLSSVCAAVLLGEAFGWASALGVAGITLGIWLIAGGRSLWARAQDSAQRERVLAGVAWGALTGVLIALYTVIDGYAVKVAMISPLLVDYFGNLCRLPFMLPSVWRDRANLRAAWRGQWRYALVMALLSPHRLRAGAVCGAAGAAFARGTSPEVSMLFAALLGGRLLGEQDRGARLLGAACMAGGVIMLALG